MLFDFLQGRRILDGLLQFFFELVHVVLAYRQAFTSGALQSIADILSSARRIAEIPSDRLLYLFTAAEEPQNNKQREHSRNEVGVRYLPCSTMVSASMAAFLSDNDDRLGCLIRHISILRTRRLSTPVRLLRRVRPVYDLYTLLPCPGMLASCHGESPAERIQQRSSAPYPWQKPSILHEALGSTGTLPRRFSRDWTRGDPRIRRKAECRGTYRPEPRRPSDRSPREGHRERPS